MSKLTLYKLNSQFIKVFGLKDQTTTPATYVNDATLVATLYDATGVAVTGAQTMTGAYQAASNGEYRFPITPASFDPPVAGSYTLIIDGTTLSGAKFHVVKAVAVAVRKEGTEV